MLKQTISQKMLQKLSPQQIQLMKLLQVPTINLEQRIKEELEANPALEEGGDSQKEDLLSDDYEASEFEDSENEKDDFELDDYVNDYIEDDPSSYKLQSNNYSADDEQQSAPVTVESSFHEHLLSQLGMIRLQDDTQMAIAKQIIGSIDEDGYLRREPIAIADDLMFAENIMVDVNQIEYILAKIQKFEPPGVGARDLQESLAIQLQRKLDNELYDGAAQAANIHMGLRIIQEYFDEFSKKHYDKLQKHLDISTEDLKEAVDEILKLNPKPASGYAPASRQSVQYVMPDFIIRNNDGELELSLNNKNLPELRINDQYKEMLQTYKLNGRKDKRIKEAGMFVKQKVEAAKWFIDAIHQRYKTMYDAMYAIMQYQYDYFLSGDEKKLRPMILKDIADITGYDISTISRVSNSKFVQTEFGTKKLKEFFSESMQTDEGEEVSTREVKKILGEIVIDENKRKPLSDEKLMKLLREKGYNIARRTVAKYREQLGIPVARLRKEL